MRQPVRLHNIRKKMAEMALLQPTVRKEESRKIGRSQSQINRDRARFSLRQSHECQWITLTGIGEGEGRALDFFCEQCHLKSTNLLSLSPRVCRTIALMFLPFPP